MADRVLTPWRDQWIVHVIRKSLRWRDASEVMELS